MAVFQCIFICNDLCIDVAHYWTHHVHAFDVDTIIDILDYVSGIVATHCSPLGHLCTNIVDIYLKVQNMM